MGWKRLGECPPSRCRGRCCEHIGAWYDNTEESRAFLGALRIRGLKVSEAGGKMLVDLPQRCQYLTVDGLCGLHPGMAPGPDLPERPQFCWDWPQEPSQLLLDDCGFRFEWSEEPEKTYVERSHLSWAQHQSHQLRPPSRTPRSPQRR